MGLQNTKYPALLQKNKKIVFYRRLERRPSGEKNNEEDWKIVREHHKKFLQGRKEIFSNSKIRNLYFTNREVFFERRRRVIFCRKSVEIIRLPKAPWVVLTSLLVSKIQKIIFIRRKKNLLPRWKTDCRYGSLKGTRHAFILDQGPNFIYFIENTILLFCKKTGLFSWRLTSKEISMTSFQAALKISFYIFTRIKDQNKKIPPDFF